MIFKTVDLSTHTINIAHVNTCTDQKYGMQKLEHNFNNKSIETLTWGSLLTEKGYSLSV